MFTETLAGLVLAEIDCPDLETFAAVVPPPGTSADVTHDDRFSGGALAAIDRRALVLLLDTFSGP